MPLKMLLLVHFIIAGHWCGTISCQKVETHTLIRQSVTVEKVLATVTSQLKYTHEKSTFYKVVYLLHFI